MPTYSYKCTECGAAFDIHQEFTDDALTVCPTCGGRLRKVFSSIGVTFNGPGFYSTDSRSASTSHDEPHTAPAKAEGASPTAGTAEKKPAGTGKKTEGAATKKKAASPAPVS
ncbi:MAG TPA: FmdB family zinc ribbon protein [Microbacteriaceae bacterium]|nr:FmdB family zinc ribbon protein [Microbacteriaceae bacterium]